ncbi:hypothetical protein J2Z69_000396 [Paenibacillus shirakamiensis]|uniref:Family 2 glycosyl transferase n=1 Tax=Paenibacillus shirakamiensis TaxID=1265935 RepID=A0ABS4JCC1_9BACL|nr:hypothetical protein [Paenibacillus shirakamiensis]MBP1999377.1 hypothetical protein [Paenibacillus shirakamiensis]
MSKLARKKLILWITIGIILIGGITSLVFLYLPPSHKSIAGTDGTKMKFQTSGDKFLRYDGNGNWKEIFVKGVNLGATVPGYFPGEFPATEEDYLRWFKQIHEMGANVIRVYTIHNPVFYKSLVKYNRDKGENPLYFIQGVYSQEDQLIETKDALGGGIPKSFEQDIDKAVKAVYGDLDIPVNAGFAGGKYTANAGQYLMAWHIGTEWDPEMVENTNKVHAGLPPYLGKYFSATAQASPFESFLATMLDYAATKEHEYGWEHPATFTNWVTTDVIKHPGEPLFQEDMVSVDATHVKAVSWEAGYFAAYHVYPYYPDFFHLDKSFQTIPDGKGGFNTYKAYLRKLKAYYKDLPIMVTEYGVPSSIGVSHIGPSGRNQGGHSEAEQGKIDASLTQDIYDEGYAGSILFMWQDEWFKKTWNTMRLETPADRRSFWLNVLTNEKQFGLVAMGSGKSDQIIIDGKLDDWSKLPADQVKQWAKVAPGIKNMRVTHDEAYVYIGLDLDKTFDPNQSQIYLGSDTQSGGDQPKIEWPNQTLSDGLEDLIVIGKDEETQVKAAPSYDFHRRLYGDYGYWMLPKATAKDKVEFQPWKLAVSLSMTPPDTRSAHPFQDAVVGALKRGTTNRSSADFDSLTSWQYSGNQIELRIPWMLLGFSDPSSKQVIDYSALKTGRTFTTTKTEGITFVPWIVDRKTKKVESSNPNKATLDMKKQPQYTWNPWESVKYTEHLKAGYYDMKDIYAKLKK